MTDCYFDCETSGEFAVTILWSFLTSLANMCIALLEHHCGKHFPGIASALVNKALVLMQQGNDIDAIASLKKALRIHESICGECGIDTLAEFGSVDPIFLQVAIYDSAAKSITILEFVM